MQWEVVASEEYGQWYETLTREQRSRIAGRVDLLKQTGPTLGRPVVDTLEGSNIPKLKELRVGTIRVLFCFDPIRRAVLLIGGDKAGRWAEFYAEAIPKAEAMYEDYVNGLREEGLL